MDTAAQRERRGRSEKNVRRPVRRRPSANAFEQNLLLAGLRRGRRPLRRLLDGRRAAGTAGAEERVKLVSSQ